MLDREPFLLAIAADPASDLPRLVFADWLDDRGDHTWAEIIRLQCDAARRVAPADDPVRCRAARLIEEQGGRADDWRWGLPDDGTVRIGADLLADPDELRRQACEHNPGWYGATTLVVTGGHVTAPTQVDTLLLSPVTRHVTALDLSGREEHLGTAHDDALGIGLIDFEYRPRITTRMVEHLCTLRECRRLVSLDLSRNELGNDAVRALSRSTNFIRLARLAVQDGNDRVKGRLWGELLARFGPEVVR